MIFKNSVITFYRGDDDSMLVVLTNEDVFHEGDKVFFSLKADPSDEIDIFQVEVDVFTSYNEIENAAVLIPIAHEQTIDLETGTYYYDILIEWADGTYVTVLPPTKFKLVPGGSHDTDSS